MSTNIERAAEVIYSKFYTHTSIETANLLAAEGLLVTDEQQDIEILVSNLGATLEDYNAERERSIKMGADIVSLARLALHTNRRSVELFVHRLAYNYRNDPIGPQLAEHDVVPGVSLRGDDALIDEQVCTTCGGGGIVEWSIPEWKPPKCPDCHGSGETTNVHGNVIDYGPQFGEEE